MCIAKPPVRRWYNKHDMIYADSLGCVSVVVLSMPLGMCIAMLPHIVAYKSRASPPPACISVMWCQHGMVSVCTSLAAAMQLCAVQRFAAGLSTNLHAIPCHLAVCVWGLCWLSKHTLSFLLCFMLLGVFRLTPVTSRSHAGSYETPLAVAGCSCRKLRQADIETCFLAV